MRVCWGGGGQRASCAHAFTRAGAASASPTAIPGARGRGAEGTVGLFGTRAGAAAAARDVKFSVKIPDRAALFSMHDDRGARGGGGGGGGGGATMDEGDDWGASKTCYQCNEVRCCAARAGAQCAGP